MTYTLARLKKQTSEISLDDRLVGSCQPSNDVKWVAPEARILEANRLSWNRSVETTASDTDQCLIAFECDCIDALPKSRKSAGLEEF